MFGAAECEKSFFAAGLDGSYADSGCSTDVSASPAPEDLSEDELESVNCSNLAVAALCPVPAGFELQFDEATGETVFVKTTADVLAPPASTYVLPLLDTHLLPVLEDELDSASCSDLADSFDEELPCSLTELLGYAESLQGEDEDDLSKPHRKESGVAMAASMQQTDEELQDAIDQETVSIKCSPHKLLYIARDVAVSQGWSNVQWRRDFSALHLAAKLNSPEVVRDLLQEGAHAGLDVQDTRMCKPIDYAIEDMVESIRNGTTHHQPVDLELLELLDPQQAC